MNTYAEYRRNSYLAAESPRSALGTEAVTSDLAHQRDPSLSPEGRSPTSLAKSIAWVRPTELATRAAPMVGRGVDLHAELIRRARRTPVTTTRKLQRGIPYSPAPGLSPDLTKGLSL